MLREKREENGVRKRGEGEGKRREEGGAEKEERTQKR